MQSLQESYSARVRQHVIEEGGGRSSYTIREGRGLELADEWGAWEEMVLERDRREKGGWKWLAKANRTEGKLHWSREGLSLLFAQAICNSVGEKATKGGCYTHSTF